MAGRRRRAVHDRSQSTAGGAHRAADQSRNEGGPAMGQTAEELRGQLGEQRAEISRDLDAIGDRVSPQRMVERRKAAMRQRVSDIKDTVMGTAESSVDTMHNAGTSTATTVIDSASSVV